MKKNVDVHVHLAAMSDGQNGCYISPKMLHSSLFRFMLWHLGLPEDNIPKANELYIQKLIGLIRESQHVSRVVLLGMDGVYDDNGALDQARTEFLISNDYVIQTTKRFPEFFKAGASINPKRKDALVELQRCVEAGAVLIKVLPNTQQFNPADAKYTQFYRAMAKNKIPLLCHVGVEFSLKGKDQSLGHPRHLQVPLDEGVTVIAAHGMSNGVIFREPYWNLLLHFIRRYPNFYWDVSALSLPNRVGMLLRLRHRPELHKRMVFGTDYPLPTFAYPPLLIGHWKSYWKLRKIKNPFDRHFLVLNDLGFQFPEKVLV